MSDTILSGPQFCCGCAGACSHIGPCSYCPTHQFGPVSPTYPYNPINPVLPPYNPTIPPHQQPYYPPGPGGPGSPFPATPQIGLVMPQMVHDAALLAALERLIAEIKIIREDVQALKRIAVNKP